MAKTKNFKTTPSQIIQYQSQTYWQSLSLKSYLKFLFAIFLIFSCIGYINDIMSGGQFSGLQLVGNVILSGVVAIAWVYSFTHNLKLIPVAILLFLISLFYADFWPALHPSHELQIRLKTDSIGIIIHLILGYIFLIQFIMTEGSQHIRMRTEMKLAKGLHDILVPAINYKKANFEVYGKAIPTDEVGGDLIDIEEKADNLTCYIADVSGHGVAAGLLMGMFKTAIHAYLQNDLSLAEILTRSNKVLMRLKKRSMFVTCAFVRFFRNNIAEYSVAGHLPIFYYKAKEEKISQLTVKQIPITAKKNYVFKTEKINFSKGDLFVLLTDGFIEVNNSKNLEFGMERFEKLLIENASLELEDIYIKIMSEVKNYGPQHDDQTMLLIRCL